MRVFKCIFSGVEVFCDFDRLLVTEDDVVYVLEGKYIEIGGEDYGLATNADEDAEEGAVAEGAESTKQRVVDVVHNNRLTETCYDKKSFMAYIKGYMKNLNDKLKESDPARSAAFVAGAQAFVKKVVASFDDYQFFLPPLSDDANQEEAILVLCKWEGEVAKFFFWKDGLKGERV